MEETSGTQALALYLYDADSFFDSRDAQSTATDETNTHLFLVAKELYIEDAKAKHKNSRRFKKVAYDIPSAIRSTAI
jgi:hypothetical protein